MNEHVRDLVELANSRGDKLGRHCDRSLPICDRADAFEESVRRLARNLWPDKGVAALRIAMHGGCDIRSAQRFMARQQGMSLPVFIALQQSEVGKPFHDLGITGSKWWAETYEDLETVAMEKKAHALLREAEQRKAKR